MNKKNLNADGLLNELKGGSAFFPVRKHEPSQQKQPSPVSQPATPKTQPKAAHPENDTVVSRYHETMIPSNHDTTIPLSKDELLELVRKAVKQIGKEPATQRLTLEEKQALDDIEYAYKRQGIKTSGNEIIRIATNYIVRDYRKNGANSILATVIQRLNS
jgi:hypothetical protein